MKEQLELLKAAPFYTNPADISSDSVNAMLQPGGDGTLPLAKLRITVRCAGLGRTYQVVGDATLMTFRTANIG